MCADRPTSPTPFNAALPTQHMPLATCTGVMGLTLAYTLGGLQLEKTLQACLANSFSSHHRAPLQRKQAWFQVRIQSVTFLRGVMGQSRTLMQTPLTARPCSGPGLSRRLQAATEKGADPSAECSNFAFGAPLRCAPHGQLRCGMFWLRPRIAKAVVPEIAPSASS